MSQESEENRVQDTNGDQEKSKSKAKDEGNLNEIKVSPSRKRTYKEFVKNTSLEKCEKNSGEDADRSNNESEKAPKLKEKKQRKINDENTQQNSQEPRLKLAYIRLIKSDTEKQSKTKKEMVNIEPAMQIDRRRQINTMCPWFQPEVFESEEDISDFSKVFNDGKRIYVNRLLFYPRQILTRHMISLNQLFLKDLGLQDHNKYTHETVKWRKPQVTCAIVNTMVYEESLLHPLIQCGIPITVFRETDPADTSLIEKDPNFQNVQFVLQDKSKPYFFGVYHSKLMLLEFEDRLRVVISSANLYRHDWEVMSQVIWFQDFYPKRPKVGTSEFETYLKEFVDIQCPQNCPPGTKIFKQEIDISKYDFSEAAVKLLATVHGRFNGADLKKYGLKRLEHITKDLQGKSKTVTFQTSSIGKLVPKFLSQFYSCLTEHNMASKKIHERFKILFPTEEYVKNSHAGVENASSCILQRKFWHEVKDFPKESFHQIQAPSEPLNHNLFHAKILIINNLSDQNTISDDSTLYFGSHNFSPSAWGWIEKQGQQISMNNWELGIVFPPGEGTAELKRNLIKTLPLKLCAAAWELSAERLGRQQPRKYDLDRDSPFIMD